MFVRRLAISLFVAALLVPAAGAGAASKVRPRAFSSCAALGDYARTQALKIVGPYGLPSRFGGERRVVDDTGAPAEPAPPGAPQETAAPREGTDFSGTNVQEEGVDEPDFAKTDGSHLYVASYGTLYVFDVRGDAPQLIGSLKLKGFGHELLVAGDRLLALGTYYDDPALQPEPQPEPRPAEPASAVPYPGSSATRLFDIDVSDRSSPRLVRTLTVEGGYVAARLRDRVARVVISTPPEPWTVESDDAPATEEEAEARQRRAIRRTKLSTWVPEGVVRNRVRDTRRTRRMVACREAARPTSFAGPGMLSLLTIDLARGLDPVDSDSLMTDAHTVYASKRSMFIATERWFDPTTSDPEKRVPPGRFTAVHRFDISQPGAAEYRATGQVPGFVLNQFSLSEHAGVLRVASTEQPPWWGGAEQRESESFVTVLDEREGVLREVGRVGGLGKGEQIYAVRFLDDVGYVVTFRQTDPLYTLDLSDPANPAVRGELKILGFSSYLHPIGADLLLGVGQDATEEGRTKGAQLSLFDVSNLNDPRRLHQQSLGEHASSEAEYDHHAFLYWPPTKLAVVPLAVYSEDESFAGAIGFGVDRDSGFSEVGRLQHQGGDYPPPIRRSMVVRGRLLTVSDRGVLASTLDTFAPVGFTPFSDAK